MKKSYLLLLGVFLALMIFSEDMEVYAITPGAPCISCHDTITPGIVKQWENSKHSEVGVKCYVCHEAKEDDPSGYDHNGYFITAIPSPKYCEGCHTKQTKEFWKSKHAWAAFMGPLKPYYIKAKKEGLDPLSQETAKKFNPVEIAKRTLSPLYPDSGALKNAGLLDNPEYDHNNIVLGCIQCHGSFVIAGEEGELEGWPNVGIGRVNPDGSLGSCTSCHTRHEFSIAQARKPYTCGQCHMGPDHPQIEIYEESKHGNIYESSGDNWNWNVPPGQWGPEDIIAPTCATCHMSGFGGAVESTHDVGERLYWELQPKISVPQWKGPDEVDLVLERIPDPEKAEQGRAKMKKICKECHSKQWTDKYFIEFDRVVNDYNKVFFYVDDLLQEAYQEGLISADNPIDEIPEVMHYYIWHHDGRRWRMGASMMGPDWTHWNGAVDALLDKLNIMQDWLTQARKIKELEKESISKSALILVGLVAITALAVAGYTATKKR
jgi:hypothetical protein